jgi:hypothetical protein
MHSRRHPPMTYSMLLPMLVIPSFHVQSCVCHQAESLCCPMSVLGWIVVTSGHCCHCCQIEEKAVLELSQSFRQKWTAVADHSTHAADSTLASTCWEIILKL